MTLVRVTWVPASAGTTEGGRGNDGRKRVRVDSGLVVCWVFMFVTSLVVCGYVVVTFDASPDYVGSRLRGNDGVVVRLAVGDLPPGLGRGFPPSRE